MFYPDYFDLQREIPQEIKSMISRLLWALEMRMVTDLQGRNVHGA
jgi:hypothetical protein